MRGNVANGGQGRHRRAADAIVGWLDLEGQISAIMSAGERRMRCYGRKFVKRIPISGW